MTRGSDTDEKESYEKILMQQKLGVTSSLKMAILDNLIVKKIDKFERDE